MKLFARPQLMLSKFAWLVALTASATLAADIPPKPNYTIERDIVYADLNGTNLCLDAYRPDGSGPFPAVLVVHGGAWRTGSKQQLSRYARRLADRGYVAFAINYRLAPEHKHPAQIDDCRAALRWVVDNAEKYKVDADRLGAIGYSAGGHLVSLLATDPTPAQQAEIGNNTALVESSTLIRLKAVVAGGAPTDFRDVAPDSAILAFWLGATREEKPELYEHASPIRYVTADDPPMLFYHGEWDTLVPPKNAEMMSAELSKAGVESELFVIEKGGHIFAMFDPAALERSIEFFDEHLKPDAPLQ